MDKNESKPGTDDVSERADAQTGSTQPRGNPETDHESVKKGEDQLDKISGN